MLPFAVERISGTNPGPGRYDQVAGTLAERRPPHHGITIGRRARSPKSRSRHDTYSRLGACAILGPAFVCSFLHRWEQLFAKF